MWGQNIPKGWGRAKEKPKVPEETVGTGEASSSRRGGSGGGGGEEMQAQEARHNVPQEQPLRASPIPVKPPAGEEGGPRDAVHGDIPGIVERTLNRRLSRHEQALGALLQDMLDEQQARFDSSLVRFWDRLNGREGQVNNLTREVVNSTGFLGRQLEEAKHEMVSAVAENTATIVEHLEQQGERVERAASTRRNSEASTRSWSDLTEEEVSGSLPEAPRRDLERSVRKSDSEAYSEAARGASARSQPVFTRLAKARCPSCYDFGVRVRRVRRSYAESLAEYRHRENKDSVLDYLVDSRAFEYMMICFICLDVTYLVYETDYSARTLQIPSGLWIEVSFLVVYSIELALKLKTQQWHFVFGPDRFVNAFDFILLVAGIAEVVTLHCRIATPIQGSSSLRIGRICRLQRVARLHRLFTITQAMQAILRCLYSSLTSLLGSALIIILYLMVFSLFFVSAVTDHIMEMEGKGGDELEFFEEHFSSVSRCMFTLYVSVSSGRDWLYFYEPLKDITAIPAAAVFVVFSFLYMVVMVNVASSIFVQKVLIHTLDETQNAKHALTRTDRVDTAWMLEFCDLKCGRGNFVNYEEFLRLMRRPEFRELFDARRVKLEDAEVVFKAFARSPPGEGIVRNWELWHVDRKLFFEACMQLKRELTTTELWKSKAAIHDSQQRHGELVVSALEKIGLQFEALSRDLGKARRAPTVDA